VEYSEATQVLVPLADGGTVPLGQIAKVSLAQGPSSIRTENSQLAAYIFVDLRDRDLGSYVANAQKAVAAQVKMTSGYYVTWSGQFEYLERAKARLQVVVPVTVLIIFLLLYLNFRRATETMIVMLSVPFALVGGLWLMWCLGFNLSVAVVVGFIVLAGVAAETGVVMLITALSALRSEREAEGRPFTRDDLHAAIMKGAVERVRPKMMTVAAIMAGLLPIMWRQVETLVNEGWDCLRRDGLITPSPGSNGRNGWMGEPPFAVPAPPRNRRRRALGRCRCGR
jgi:Cu(I)/Ag(I) efflux system membrane protein CusA/SilA